MGLGFYAFLADYGVGGVKVALCWEAAAGKGVAERRGVGRVWHQRAPLLWPQRVVQEGRLQVRKVDGAANVADVGATHVEAASIENFMDASGFEFSGGRSRLALRAALGGEG